MRLKLFIIIASGSAISLVRAQLPNASQQVDSAWQLRQMQSTLPGETNAAPEFYAGETSDVGPQSVLQFKRPRTYLAAFADEQFLYTDNVFLGDQGQQGADVLISTLEVALAPTPYEFAGGLLAPRLGYQQQWFTYGLVGSETVSVYPPFRTVNINQFDFNASTVFSDVAWRWKNWTFTVGGDYRRLLDSGNYEEFYHEFIPRWAVRRDFSVNNSFAVSIGYEGDYRFTQSAPPNFANPLPAGHPPKYPDTFNDRTDHSLVLAGNWWLCRYAILQPFYRLQYSHYTQIERNDWLNSFGLTLCCPLTQNISFRTFVSYDLLNTDGFYAQNFKRLDAGVGLNLNVRF